MHTDFRNYIIMSTLLINCCRSGVPAYLKPEGFNKVKLINYEGENHYVIEVD